MTIERMDLIPHKTASVDIPTTYPYIATMIKTLLKLVPAKWRKTNNVIHILRLQGAISAGGGLRPALNAKDLEPLLQRAFKKGVSGVALAINCPGGSPVQSSLIAARIRALSAEHKIPVYAFCEDVAASGGYWLACAADEIYADESSIVGSIGVIASGFGFVEAIKKLGVERRVYTSGTSKSILDPFKPEKKQDVDRLLELQEDVHEGFKTYVRTRRAGKLKAEESELFTGAFWTGKRGLALGLVDGIGHAHEILRRKFGEQVEIKEISAAKGWGLKRFGFGSAIELPEAAINALETRALWSRFGL
jgi:signal peptide peptidase SppA